jgi:5-methylcytosine-specific restriction endonuclease McrA
MLVFVLGKTGKALMPCSPGKARKLLSSQKAKVVCKSPFTIRLLYGSSGYKQEVIAGMDTGSKKIGCAAVSGAKVLYQSEIELRSDVSAKMQQRAMYRRTRRTRKTRYRPARFDNRGKANKLAPSVQSKLDSHLREKQFIESILPITHWKVEVASFDIHKISNPSVSKTQGWTYQEGQQKGFYNLKAYILSRDGYTCQQCKKNKNLHLHVHHIVFRSQGGTDSPENLITLCEPCHEALHAGTLADTIHSKLTKKIKSKTKHATEIGILKSQLIKCQKSENWTFEQTFGYETKYQREVHLKLPKTHYFDAVAICTNEAQNVIPQPWVYFKRAISKGDYQQTAGARSEQRIPTKKLFGIRKFDRIETPKGTGFVKGKRSSGYFAICRIDGTKISDSVSVKSNCTRLQARTSTLTQKKESGFLPALKDRVSAAEESDESPEIRWQFCCKRKAHSTCSRHSQDVEYRALPCRCILSNRNSHRCSSWCGSKSECS